MNRSSGPLRVLIATVDYPPPPGGIQTTTLNLEKGLESIGHEVRVLDLDPRERRTNWRHLFPSLRWSYLLSSLRYDDWYLEEAYQRTKRAIHRFDPTVVHAMHVYNWPVLRAAAEENIPCVLSVHGVELADEKLAKRALRTASVVHAVSSFTLSLIRRFPWEESLDVEVIPPSVDLSRYREARHQSSGPPGPVLTLSRLVDRKNIVTVLRAWGRLGQSAKEGRHLVIAGDGPNRVAVERAAAHFEDVRVTGRVPERKKPEMLANADVFTLVPKKNGYDVEGFGIVYIEAQAAGTPVIGSAHGGAPDAIGEGGIVLEEESDPEAVSDALRYLLVDSDARDEMRRLALSRVKRFGLNRVAERHATVYRKLAQGAEGR